jgi:hypothetical protein
LQDFWCISMNFRSSIIMQAVNDAIRKCNIRIMISNSEINISSSPSTFLEKSWIEWIYLHTWHHSRWTKINRSRMFLIFIQWETIYSGVYDKLN